MKKLLLVATLGVAGFMSANTGSYGTKLNNESQKIDVTLEETCSRCVRQTTTTTNPTTGETTTTTIQYCYQIKCFTLTAPTPIDTTIG